MCRVPVKLAEVNAPESALDDPISTTLTFNLHIFHAPANSELIEYIKL